MQPQYGNNFQYDTIAICNALTHNSNIFGVACIEINFNRFLGGLSQAIYVLDAVGVNSRGHLVSPIKKADPALVTSVMLSNEQLVVLYYNGSEHYTLTEANGEDVWANTQCSTDG